MKYMSGTNNSNIVFVCSDCDNTRILYHGIKDTVNITTIITEQTESKGKLVRRRIKRLGFFKVAGQLIFQAGVTPFIRFLSASLIRRFLQENNLNTAAMPENLIRKIESVNDSGFIKIIAEIKPSLILVNGTRIISAKTLNSINCPIINVHVGITPLYRGVHGAYWALANNDKKNCGVTIHAIDKGIDTGKILAQDTIEPRRNDNFVTYPYLQFQKAISLVKKVIPEILKGEMKFINPPQGRSKLWYHPTVWQYLYYRLKGIK